jgi:hypothetical protein
LWCLNYGFYRRTMQIINRQNDLTDFGQGISQRGLGIEGIGISGEKGKK